MDGSGQEGFVESSRIYDVVKESMRKTIDEYAEVMCFVQRWLSSLLKGGLFVSGSWALDLTKPGRLL